MSTTTATPPATTRNRRPTPSPRPWGRLVLLAAVVLALAAVPFLVGPYGQQVGYRVLQLAALAVAWNLVAGYTGMVSLGSAAFVGLGAYAATEIANRTGAPLPVMMLAGAVVAAVFAVVVSPAMFRLSGLYFTVGTLALASALQILVINLDTFGGASGLIVDVTTPPDYVLYWTILAVAVACTVVVMVLMATPASLSLRAIRDDEATARQMGVVTFRTKLWVFALSGAMIGVVGAIQSTRLGVVEPYGTFGLNWTIMILAATIIGGLGTQAGPWVGAVLYVLLAEALKDYPEIHIAITGAVLVLVIRFAPNGIWGALVHQLGRRTGANR
ncbi:branched-chain amino acid ABC transporter permease [Solicola sp. PLA-1-18]|uniref:branched-chain amino acid ABC transporter permease n=1 Tax=Solicola sp. PLA-1-18 TaxID=3380532 RepID=UPI003B80D2EC